MNGGYPRRSYRLLFEHPREDRFTGVQFVEECERMGLHVGGRYVQRFLGEFVIGVPVCH